MGVRQGLSFSPLLRVPAPWLCAGGLWLSDGHPWGRVNNSGQWRFTPFWAAFLRPGDHFSPHLLIPDLKNECVHLKGGSSCLSEQLQ